MTMVYLAIGTPKTGTTALQSFMRKNEERMHSQGYAYPLMEIGLPELYRNRNGQFLIYDREGAEEIRRKGFEQLAEVAEKYPNIILSDEQIWYRSRKTEDFWERTREELHRIGCELKVVVYLRRQDLLFQSLWNQNIKAWRMSVMTFEEAVRSDMSRDYCLDYYENLCYIARRVGKENMIVRPYERGQFAEGKKDILLDFFQNVGMELTEDFVREGISVNIGLEGNYIEIKRIMNGVPEYRKMKDFMFRPVQKGSIWCSNRGKNRKAVMFSAEGYAEFMEKYKEGNQRVAREFLKREDGRLYMEEKKNEEKWTVDQAQMYRDIVIVMTETFCAQEKRLRKIEEKVRESEALWKRRLLIRVKNKIKRLFFHT